MKLIKYLPKYMAEYIEINEICRAEDIEMNSVSSDIEGIGKEFFIESASEYGIERLEGLLGINASDEESMDYRKFRLNMKLNGHRDTLIEALDAIVENGDYVLELDTDELVMNVRLPLINKGYLNAVEEMLDKMLPANIELNCYIMYATHKSVGAYRHSELKSHTHKQIRELV